MTQFLHISLHSFLPQLNFLVCLTPYFVYRLNNFIWVFRKSHYVSWNDLRISSLWNSLELHILSNCKVKHRHIRSVLISIVIDLRLLIHYKLSNSLPIKYHIHICHIQLKLWNNNHSQNNDNIIVLHMRPYPRIMRDQVTDRLNGDIQSNRYNQHTVHKSHQNIKQRESSLWILIACVSMQEHCK